MRLNGVGGERKEKKKNKQKKAHMPVSRSISLVSQLGRLLLSEENNIVKFNIFTKILDENLSTEKYLSSGATLMFLALFV